MFTLAADSITQIGYTNSYFSSGTTLTLTSTPMVVVAIDASLGRVQLVAPAAAKATSRLSGTHVVYTGKFTAVYDKSGKNLAPNGASSLTVDAKSGNLVSFG